MKGHEAREGNNIRVGDFIEQPARIGGAAKFSIGPKDFTGNRLVAGVEAMGKGLGMDSLELSYGFALVEKMVANTSIHPPSSTQQALSNSNTWNYS
uniref:Uncharacterized protein n=1 Tax=Oryza brachyantha TaxID=4533 RepID=J3L8Y2_ORYBR